MALLSAFDEARKQFDTFFKGFIPNAKPKPKQAYAPPVEKPKPDFFADLGVSARNVYDTIKPQVQNYASKLYNEPLKFPTYVPFADKLPTIRQTSEYVGGKLKESSDKNDLFMTLMKDKNRRANMTPEEDQFVKDTMSNLILGEVGPIGGIGAKGLSKASKPLTKAITPLARAAQSKLSGLINYSDDLIRRGFKKEVVDKVSYSDYQKLVKNPNFDEEVKAFDRIINTKQTPVEKKVNLLDYSRTPDRVLKKIGLEKEGKTLRISWEKYQQELPEEINKLREWIKRVPSKESNVKIFKFLDGQKEIRLDKTELQVASEIKQYLSTWANKLGLPKEKRITNYITHVFEPDFIRKEFDEDLAKLISGKIPGSVYDPFVQQRLGKQGYIEDTWRALQAYVKRGVRKYNLDPALKLIQDKSETLEDSQVKYLTRLTERINLRPTEIDNLVDNLIKSSPIGYRFGQRPVQALSQAQRQLVYRGTLGLNVSSAIRNLTQGANTYAKLGEKYTSIGYLKNFKNWNSDELKRVGVLNDSFIQDKSLNAKRTILERLDPALWALFNTAEKINRGSAYYGAKAKSIASGMNENEAIEYAKKLVRDTQFSFGSIDTPVALQSDIVKTLAQFQSFNVKQTEFLAEMVKNKEYAGLIRWLSSTLVMAYGLKEGLGISLNAIPFQEIISGESKLGETPIVQAAQASGKLAFGDEQAKTEAMKDLGRTARAFVPGGVQIGKTLENVRDTMRGGSLTPTNRLRFPVEPDVRGLLFGSYATPGGQQYIDEQILNNPRSDIERQAQDFQGEQTTLANEERAIGIETYLQLAKLNNPDERKALLQKLADEGKLTDGVKKEIKKQKELAQRQKTESNFTKAVRSISTNNGKARFLLRVFKEKSVDERKEILRELAQSGLLTDDLKKKLKEEKING